MLNFAAILMLGTFCVPGQDGARDLKEKRVTIKLDRRPLGWVFSVLTLKYDVPIGFEEAAEDREHNDYDFLTNSPSAKRYRVIDESEQILVTAPLILEVNPHYFTVNMENERLDVVLDLVVGQMKNYRWEIADGVVNILPIKSRDERYEKLLALRIARFSVGKREPIGVIKNAIFALPEVSEFLKSENLLFSTYRNGNLNGLQKGLAVEINLTNLSLREVLNKITRIKRGGWIVKKSDLFGTKVTEYIDIDI